MLTEETKRVIINIRHITLVQKHLYRIAAELQARAIEHDVSKFKFDEFEGFVQLNEADKQFGYGTAAYKEAIEGNNAAQIHTSRNSHHPEFHPGGASDMGFFDFLEMVIDWIAANQVYGNTSLEESIETSIKRFNLSPEQVYMVGLIVEALT